jgi:hypothetical protein
MTKKSMSFTLPLCHSRANGNPKQAKRFQLAEMFPRKRIKLSCMYSKKGKAHKTKNFSLFYYVFLDTRLRGYDERGSQA